MKWPSILSKNLKLLFRSKETAFTIIFGPLLIILLVSAAYTGGDTESAIRLGTYAPEYTTLADGVISSLKEEGYHVSVFNQREECIDLIKEAQLHTCILFPAEFHIKENGTNRVTFAVDSSRINLVYQIIESLGEQFDVQREAISESFAGDVLSRLSLTQQELHAQLESAQLIDEEHSEIALKLDEGREEIAGVDTQLNVADLKGVRGHINGLNRIIGDLRDEGGEAVTEALDALRELEEEYLDECENCSNTTEILMAETIDDLENASETIQDIADDAPDAVIAAGEAIDEAALSLKRMQERFDELVEASEEVDTGLAQSSERLTEASQKLTQLRGTLGHLDRSLQEAMGMQASSIASPITTHIETITAEEDNLVFTYPYVLMLIIMFLGLMLSSTLIVMDKTSTAAFRSFTTATRDEYYLVMSFVTTFFILLVQTLIVLLASYAFLGLSLFENFGVSLLVIFLAITLFSFLGMIIGYLAGTQESAMIASLSIGSVFLFISNLVLPLEAMNRLVQTLSVYNPYVVLSELLKQSMLFGLELEEVPGKMALLVVTIALLFGCILLVQRSFKRRFFQRRSKDLAAAAFTPKSREVKPLLVGDREVRNLFDLLNALDGMTRAEFEQVAAKKEHPIANWVAKELGEKRLARKLRTRSKERIILALDKHLKRQTKRLQRQR